MAWIADVAPRQTISSAQWGNPMRDRVTHHFASVAERNATAVPIEGMMAWTTAEQTLAIYTTGVWVVLYQPWQAFAPTSVPMGTGSTPITGRYRCDFKRRGDEIDYTFDLLCTGATPTPAQYSGVWIPLPIVGYEVDRGQVIGTGAVQDFISGGPGYQPGNVIISTDGTSCFVLRADAAQAYVTATQPNANFNLNGTVRYRATATT